MGAAPVSRNELASLRLMAPSEAGMVLKHALGLWSQADSSGQEMALAAIRREPKAALACLNESQEQLGLSLRQMGDAFELILATAGDDYAMSSELVRQVAPERIVELAVLRSDLPSIASEILPLPHLLAIVLTVACESPRAVPASQVIKKQRHHYSLDDMEEGDDGQWKPAMPRAGSEVSEAADGLPSLQEFLTWALKVRERSDYRLLLDSCVGPATFRDWLLLAVWEAARYPNAVAQVSSSAFAEVELDPVVSYLRLEMLIESGLHDFHLDVLMEARSQAMDMLREKVHAHRAGQDAIRLAAATLTF